MLPTPLGKTSSKWKQIYVNRKHLRAFDTYHRRISPYVITIMGRRWRESVRRYQRASSYPSLFLEVFNVEGHKRREAYGGTDSEEQSFMNYNFFAPA
jgi:hypothetical protein